MKPVSPVIKGFEQFEFNLAENQPQYLPIPTIVAGGDDKRFISRWEFTDEERRAIEAGGSLLLHQLTFGQPFQPVALYIEGPDAEAVREMDGV